MAPQDVQVLTKEYIDLKSLPSIESLDDLIRELRCAFDENVVNVEYVKALLSKYKSNPDDWKKYAQFQPHRFHITTIYY